MLLVKQLVYEQCTTECKRAITPWKEKGLEDWIKACREIEGPLTNAGLAAAMIAATKGSLLVRTLFLYLSFQSNRLSRFLQGNWTQEGERLTQELLSQIANLNGTRVEPLSVADFASWASSIFSYFKEWVGVGLFGAMLLCGLVLCLWMICCMRRTQQSDRVKVVQTLAALEAGASPRLMRFSILQVTSQVFS
uniref:Uncharacterized protein n=1 Tax=Spermophilus dauricus TaxID=99837 RepID=A0A8C9Q7F9_SPEDA